jgi:hypothetical protein
MHTGQTGLSGLSGLLGGFSPAQAPGLQDWLKADAGTYEDTARTVLAVADGAQGGWQDQSGQGNHATQGTASRRPTLKLAIQNGLPVLRCDGVDDGLLLSAAIRDLLLSSNQHVFVVAKYLTLTTLTWLLNVTNAAGSTRKGLECISVPPANRVIIYDNGAQASLTGTQVLTSSWNVWELQAQGSNLSEWADGVQDGVTKTDAVAASTPGVGAALGCNANGTSGFANLDLGEILVYNAVLSASNRAAVLAYLKQRWGTP